jgi:large subunit ribosomal protein L4
MAAIFSQLAREGRLAVVDSITGRGAQDQAAGAEVQGDGPRFRAGDRRPGRRQPRCWPRATSPTCWWSSRATPIRCRSVFYKKVLVTKGAIEQLKEMLA